MPKQYQLTKKELDTLNNILNVLSIQQEILTSITERYQNTVIRILDRCKEDPKSFEFSKIDFNNGFLFINFPEKKQEVKK